MRAALVPLPPSSPGPIRHPGPDGQARDELNESMQRLSGRLGFGAVLAPLPASDPRPRLRWDDLSGPAFEAALAAVGRIGGVTQRRIAATFLHGYVTYYLLAPTLDLLMEEHRLLAMEPDGLELAWDGESWVTMVYPGGVSVLPDDALAGSVRVTVCADEAQLMDRLHDAIVTCFGSTLAAFRQQAGLSSRLQWSQVSDRMAVTFQYLGRRLGREAYGVDLAERLLGRPGSPLHPKRGRFLTVVADDLERTIYQRSGCCLSYEAHGGDYCMTCPVLDEPERLRRMQAWIREDASRA